MKKTILICSFIVLMVTGCNKSIKNETDDIHSFKGTIIECEQNFMIVRPNDNEDEYKSSDKFRVEYVNVFNSCSV